MKKSERVAALIPNGVPRWVRIYDNGGKTADRYAVVFTGNFRGRDGQCFHLFMSGAPFWPQGVCMHGSTREIIDRPTYGHLGKRIKFADLNSDCQRAVMQDYVYLWDLDLPEYKGVYPEKT